MTKPRPVFSRPNSISGIGLILVVLRIQQIIVHVKTTSRKSYPADLKSTILEKFAMKSIKGFSWGGDT
jgi:hypothetical protein